MDKILIVKKVSFLILITFFSFNCSENENTQNIEKLVNTYPFSKLIELGYEYRNDTLFNEICNNLNDSISLNNPFICMESAIGIDSDKEDVRYIFFSYDFIPRIENRNFLIVSIKDENTILVNNEMNKISNIKKLTKNFISQPDSICNCYETKDFVFFGKVEIPKRGIQLSINIKNKEGLTKKEWRLFFNTMHEIISVYEEKRNEISMSKWGVKYDSLDLDKKIIVTEIANLIMFIFFDKDY